MKICWDNLEKLIFLPKKGEWIFINGKERRYYIEMDNCLVCNESFLTVKYRKNKFCSKGCSQKGKFNNFNLKELKGKNHSQWKGGYVSNDIADYDTYSSRLNWCEKVRRNKEDKNILEVKCAYCGKWYIPSYKSITNRLSAIEGRSKNAEHRFYCSKECKQECPIYRKQKYPKGYKKASSREVQPELRQLVFERDDWTCQKCGSEKNLHCHHVEGIRWEPLESADIDKCITYCKSCHKEVHKIEECGYQDMQCKEKLAWQE